MNAGQESLFPESFRRLDAFVCNNLSGDYIAFSREEARELVEVFEARESQLQRWLAWLNEPTDAKTWDVNLVAAATRALLAPRQRVTPPESFTDAVVEDIQRRIDSGEYVPADIDEGEEFE